MSKRSIAIATACAAAAAGVLYAAAPDREAPAGPPLDPASLVDPLVGTANGGNTFPGAVVPFGMLQWSPENTRGDHTRVAAPGGYQFDAKRIRGFSLTHLSGTGCRGASGDVPFMPVAAAVTTSPSADAKDSVYSTRFAHANEHASAGSYRVRLESGIQVELTATARTGVGRFTYPAGKPATLLVRASDSEVGSSDARVQVDASARRITGSVTSGNFCGYIDEVDRRSYYTLYFAAVFDRPFTAIGVWHDERVVPDAVEASGGTTYGSDGYPANGKGSGAYVAFGERSGVAVNMRVGISYVSVANAEANLRAESPEGTSFEDAASRARSAWTEALARIGVDGGTGSERTIFYTALYHALLHPNLFSDVNGEYRGFDGQVHKTAGRQRAQYANFSGWDVYRSQLQLVALLDPGVASDIAQSLLNQADQNHGEWDRWTHNSGATHVMEGDPSPAAIAGIVAFGGTAFDVDAAYRSLARAATTPTAADASSRGCPVECPGQRPSLDEWLKLHYVPAASHAWGGAGETLEDAAADFSLAQLARRLGKAAEADDFLRRSGYWRNVFNDNVRLKSDATTTPDAARDGFVQNRRADGTWPDLDPSSDEGFAEGSSAQYTWMVPFDPRGLFDAMGGTPRALARLDAFFHNPDGSWALTTLGGLHTEMDNEPSTATPWLYDYTGRPDRAQETVRQAMLALWSDSPHGIPGNDDLGAMSAWFVWAALGMYPGIPGRAELLIGSPLFPHVVIARGNGVRITIDAPNARADAPFVTHLLLDGQPTTRPWLPDTFVADGGTLSYELSAHPDVPWGRAPADEPPSFPPPR
ncbi:MAG: GH92 family glycosyl hydrolase [Betaproteobacteria bacterium]